MEFSLYLAASATAQIEIVVGGGATTFT